MLQNYIKTAWRNLLKNRFYSVINITGLAIGLAVGIMILLWVKDELSYDRFHNNAAHIYKVNSHIGKGENAQVWAGAPAPVAVFAKQSIPEVKNAVRILYRGDQIAFTYNNTKFVESRSAFVDPSFFIIFDFKLIQGSKSTPFTDNNSVIITSSVAKKYFGNEDAMGKVLVSGKDNFTVTGVIEDFPENSTINYNMLFPMSLYAKNFQGNGEWKTIDEDLGNFPYRIFMQLDDQASADVVGKKISQIYRSKRDPGNSTFFTMQSLKDVHLIEPDGSSSALQTVRIFTMVAILILLIACINYVNLSTARSMIRSKEVSIRKIIGAARVQLFMQFIAESALLFLFASIIAIAIIYFVFPFYNELSGKHMVFSLASKNVWLVILIAILATLLMSGIYPALLLSSFKPIQALKGKLSFGVGSTSFRKVLVVTQFIFSVALIIATIVISNQLRFIREKDLGYNKEQVFTVNMKEDMHNHYDAVRNDLLKEQGIINVASSDNSILGEGGTTGDNYWDGKKNDEMMLVHPNAIDQHLIPLLKMKIIAGNNFAGTKADSTHFILNETAVKQAGIKDPIGKSFTLWQTKGTIIGVVKDFNFASLKQTIEPTVFYYYPPNWTLYVKTNGRDAPKAIAAVEKVWKQYTSDFPFEYSFMDDSYDRMYRSEQRTGVLFQVFAGVAILISCLGLLGLATFTAQIKTKEIGIRKVLGASVLNITGFLAKDFIRLVLIAFLIAAPLSWWLSDKWLQNFAYRINISAWVFVLAALLAVVIAFIAVSIQTLRAAQANPVKSLKEI